MLAEADQILAEVAIADAQANSGNADDIAVAQALKAEGDAAKASGGSQICDVALDKYEEAWEKAVGSYSLSKSAAPSVASEVSVPEGYWLEQNYPNPFNPQTTIRFGLPESAQVRLLVYDVLGRPVRVLVDGTREAGTHEVVFEAGNLPSGTYLVRLETPQGSFVQTMQLMK